MDELLQNFKFRQCCCAMSSRRTSSRDPGGLEKAPSVGRRAAITVHVLRRHGRVYFVAPVRECRPPRSPFSAASSDHHEARPLVLSALLLAGPMPVGRSLRVLVPAPPLL